MDVKSPKFTRKNQRIVTFFSLFFLPRFSGFFCGAKNFVNSVSTKTMQLFGGIVPILPLVDCCFRALLTQKQAGSFFFDMMVVKHPAHNETAMFGRKQKKHMIKDPPSEDFSVGWLRRQENAELLRLQLRYGQLRQNEAETWLGVLGDMICARV